MTPDLRWLLWTVPLVFLQIMVAAVAANRQVGSMRLVGNRDDPVVLTGFAGRAGRAYRNTLETLPLFIALVLIAQVSGRADATTALGSLLFFWGRVAHWLIYLAGIPIARTLAWIVSVAGMAMIFIHLV